MTELTREELARIDERFKSGNSIPIERAYITSTEWAALLQLAQRVMDAPVAAVLETDLIKLLVKIGYYDGQRVKLLVSVPTKGE